MNNTPGSGPDWLGLLQWSLAHSDGTNPTDFSKMDQEDVKWLEEAMTDLVKDEPKRMNTILHQFIDVLNGIDDGSITQDSLDNDNGIATDKMIDELSELQDITEQLDMANICIKFGGLKILINIMESEVLDLEVRCIAATTLGTLAQNNLKVQQLIYLDEDNSNTINKLTKLILQTTSYKLCSKVIYAISCVIRNHNESEKLFCGELNTSNLINNEECNAIKIFTKAMLLCNIDTIDSKNIAFIKRAIFLSNALVSSDCCSKERIELISNMFLPNCLCLIYNEDVDTRELVITFLTTLSQLEYSKRKLNNEYNTVLLSSIDQHESKCTNIATDEASLEQDEHERKVINLFLLSLSNKLKVRTLEDAIEAASSSEVPLLIK
jgi:hsp70-interacting protein